LADGWKKDSEWDAQGKLSLVRFVVADKWEEALKLHMSNRVLEASLTLLVELKELITE
jgi:hypothetical protein